MKKAFYIFLIMMLGLTVLTGCGKTGVDGAGAGTAVFSGAAAESGPLPAMGRIYITSSGAPGEEYAPAQVAWSGGGQGEGTGSDAAGPGAGQVQGSGTEGMPAEIKLRGNSSKEVDKKAYTVKFEADHGLLGMEPGRKWALVSDPFDKSLLRPAVGLEFAKALGIDYTPDFRLSQVWLNGDYMGVYTVMEPIEEGEGRVEIDTAEGDFLLERNIGRYEEDVVYIDSPLGIRFEFNEPDEPEQEQMELCRTLLQGAEEAICSGDHREYEEFIDVDSFVDFYVFNELVKDVDFGEYSTRYYFRGGVLHAGPPWDLDLTMGNVSTKKEEFKYAAYNNVDGAGDESGDSARGLWADSGDYYYWLCRDPWFMEKVQQRWQAVRHEAENLAVENGLGGSVIDRYLEAYEEELAGNFRGESGSAAADGTGLPGGSGPVDGSWTVDEPAHMSEWQEPADSYIENVEMLRVWLIKRIAYLDSQFGPFMYDPALAVQ